MSVDDAGAFDALVAAAAEGDQMALTALYRAHQPGLVRFLAGLVPDDAEDLAAETWIDISRSLATFEGGGQDFRRLLFTIARRRAIDHGRKRQRRRTEPTDLATHGGYAGGVDPSEVIAELDSSRRAVHQITKLLPHQQAEVILLRVVAGLSLSDVALIVGKSPGAVSVLQTRGLQRLAAKIGNPTRLTRESEPR
ncbi:MAG TPA: RNA polymerase sigma factor [Acidimicrobiales bacterium]|nr:RNA polymerase sigma factor [Acidimicrobiales bacterium]